MTTTEPVVKKLGKSTAIYCPDCDLTVIVPPSASSPDWIATVRAHIKERHS